MACSRAGALARSFANSSPNASLVIVISGGENGRRDVVVAFTAVHLFFVWVLELGTLASALQAARAHDLSCFFAVIGA